MKMKSGLAAMTLVNCAEKSWSLVVITSYSIHYTKLYDEAADGTKSAVPAARPPRKTAAIHHEPAVRNNFV